MRRRRIILLSFLLIISFIFLISSTYAWFSISQDIESTGISIKVNAVKHLEVSTDAKTWRQSLTLYDILNADYEIDRFNQIPIKFQPVSTAGYLSEGHLDMFLGIVSTNKDETSSSYGKYTLTSKQEVVSDGETGKYLAFDIYFKSDGEKPLYLGKKSYVKYENLESGIQNSLRMAFVKEGSTTSTDITTIQSLNTSDSSNVVIWEPNYDSHTEAAILNAKSVYNLYISNNDNKKISYYGLKSVIKDPVLITSNDDNYFELVDNIVYTDENYNNESSDNVLLFNLENGITKVRVYAWVEGQDVDCENKAAGSSFILNMHFTNEIK